MGIIDALLFTCCGFAMLFWGWLVYRITPDEYDIYNYREEE